MSNELDITNVVTISLSAAQTGLGDYNVHNLAIFTSDTVGDTFGDLGYKIYKAPKEVGVDFGTTSATYKMALAVFAQSPNILNGDGYLVVIPFASASETLDVAINRTSSLVQYFGILSTKDYDAEEIADAAAVVQTMNKMMFVVSNDASDIAAAGSFHDIAEAGYDKTRCLAYLSDTTLDAKVMAAAYAGRALSTAFEGSNTTSTMHLKDLVGITADPTMTQTQLNLCQDCGADAYVNIAGVAKTFTSGVNGFFDQVYNRCWFLGALEVAGFNALAKVSTKIPQTEPGMTLLKGAYRLICEQAVRNGYIAPGAWNSADRFGDVEAMLRNIEEVGYYIYSLPVNLQSQTDREARKAPLIQIAIKEAGAIHSTSVIVYINA
jgi:hypothetical protein